MLLELIQPILELDIYQLFYVLCRVAINKLFVFWMQNCDVIVTYIVKILIGTNEAASSLFEQR